MPLYQYSCTCGEKKDVLRSFTDTSEQVCLCGLGMTKDFAPSMLGHVRGSTPAKAYKEKRVRAKRNAELGVKQIERYGCGSSLVPNVDGEETGSWSDAAKLAKEGGKDTSQYVALAAVEKNKQNSRNIDEVKWKAAKEHLRQVGK